MDRYMLLNKYRDCVDKLYHYGGINWRVIILTLRLAGKTDNFQIWPIFFIELFTLLLVSSKWPKNVIKKYEHALMLKEAFYSQVA